MPDRQSIETIVVGCPGPVGSALIFTMKTAALLRRARIQVRENGILNYRRFLDPSRSPQASGN
jgi:hypothetical protein